MLTMSKMVLVTAPSGRPDPACTRASLTLMQDEQPSASDPDSAGSSTPESGAAPELTGAELGLAVAHEVMGWHSDHEQFTDCWVDAKGKLTGYYYGRPFSPYRDRNALAEVWKRIDALGLRARYMESLEDLLGASTLADRPVDAWSLHTCHPEIACRAALLAVRGKR